MKIALLTDGIYPYVIGGMQRHSFQLVKYFAQKKHTVYLFHCNSSTYDVTKLEFFSPEEKQFIHSFVIPFPHKSYFPFHYLFESWQYSKYIRHSLEKVISDVDFVFAQGFCAWSLLANKGNSKFPPITVHFHGLEMFQEVPDLKSTLVKYFLQKAVKYNLRKADYCISYGGKITKLLSTVIAKEKIWEIPGSMEDSWFTENTHSTADVVRFVFMGRYERRKGIAELDSAIRKLLPDKNFTFDFIGPIPAKHKITSPQIIYHGQLSSGSEIKRILSGADVLVCPSYAEGMPNVIMEAMACGLAIVATDVGAVSLLVNNENGWLLPHPGIEKIHAALNEVIASKGGILEQKKANSSEKIKNYTFDIVTGLLIECMEEAKKKTSLQ